MINPTREQVRELMREFLDLDVSDNCVDYISFRVADEEYEKYTDIINEIYRELKEYKEEGMC